MPEFDWGSAPVPKPTTPNFDWGTAPIKQPEIDFSTAPMPKPIKPIVNLPEVVKSGVGSFWNSVGKNASKVVDWATTPMLPREEKDITEFTGKLPYAGPLAEKLTGFMVGGASAPFGLGTLGAATIGGKLLKAGASRLFKAVPKVEIPIGPLTMEEAFKAEVAAAKPLRQSQEALYSQERSKRVKDMLKVNAEGEKGFYRQKSKLGGELPTVPFATIREKFTQDNINTLFNTIEKSKLSPLDKVSAKSGLAKIMGSDIAGVPETSEIKLLQQVFPGLSVPQAKTNPITEVGNTARALMASGDVTSFPLRQGATLMSRKQFWEAIPKGVTSVSGAKYNEVMDGVKSSKYFNLGQDFGGLQITDIDDIARSEELFSSKVAELPIIKQSAQAYSANANALRQGLFDELVDKYAKLGRDVDPKSKTFDAKLISDLGKYINDATGRGSLGALEPHARLINATLFSPRLMSSRLSLVFNRGLKDTAKATANIPLKALGKTPYETIDPLIRKEFWRDTLSYASIQGAYLASLKYAQSKGQDISVGDEPTSADWGKARIGNTRLDTNGGFQPIFRTLAQIAQQAKTSSVSGKRQELEKGFRPESTYDVLMSFIESKESPFVSFVTNAMRGEDIVGQPVTISSEMRNKLTPIIAQDIISLLEEDPSLLPLIIPANFGAGLQVYGSGDIKKQPTKGGPLTVTIPKIQIPKVGR